MSRLLLESQTKISRTLKNWIYGRLLLTCLKGRQEATVLQLPATAVGSKASQRAAYV